MPGVEGQPAETPLPGDAQAGLIGIQGDDLGGAEQAGAEHGAQTDRPRANDRHGIPRPNGAQFRPKIAAGQDIPKQQRLFIGHAVGNGGQAAVGEGDTDIFRLAAVDAAAQFPAAAFAVVDIPLAAEPAVPAEGDAVGGHPLAGAQAVHPLPDGDDLPDELMAQDDAVPRPGHRAVQNMQIAGADGGQRDPHQGVPPVQQGGDGAFLQAGLVSPAHQRHHGCGHIGASSSS